MTGIAELIDAVYRAPDDLELRLVLADALLEAGDPRGELILLQHRPEVDTEQRVMRLLQQHGLTWLGSLRGAVVPLGYELGFLASCIAHDPSAAGRPEWATVHSVELDVDDIGLVFDPVMRSLRRITEVEEPQLQELVRRRRSPAEVAATLAWDELPRVYGALASLPSLARFELRGLRLTRAAGGSLSVLEALTGDALVPLLEDLPRDCLTRLVVYGVAPTHHAAIETAARRAQPRLGELELKAARLFRR